MVNNYIAEIGLNHNGSVNSAKDHIIEARKSGATIAKFQTYFTETRPFKDPSLRQILKDCELSQEEFKEVKSFCDESNINFCSTPFCVDSVDVLENIGCKIFKIASFHMNNFELIDRVLKSRCCETLLISTGISDAKKLALLDSFISNHKPKHIKIVVMHCISQYPIQEKSSLNLVNIPMLAKLNCCDEVGYSDHSLGIEAASYATILGARHIEKHFTIDPSLPGADHAMSASPEVFSQLVKACDDALISLGNNRGDIEYPYEADCKQFIKETVI